MKINSDSPIQVNYAAEVLMNDAKLQMRDQEPKSVKRLRKCNAFVYETETYYVLRSYRTLVACINKHTGQAADVLRLVYGHTSTSCQHISKFFHDYSAKTIYRWYDI